MSPQHQESGEAFQVSDAQMQHHMKYVGRTGGFKIEDGKQCVPKPEEVVGLGWEPEAYLDQFKTA